MKNLHPQQKLLLLFTLLFLITALAASLVAVQQRQTTRSRATAVLPLERDGDKCYYNCRALDNDGAACLSNSTYCKWSPAGLRGGTCYWRKPGDPGTTYYTTKQYLPSCSPGTTINVGGQPNGSLCTEGSQCLSGLCIKSPDGDKICQSNIGPLPNGAICTEGGQCQSGLCIKESSGDKRCQSPPIASPPTCGSYNLRIVMLPDANQVSWEGNNLDHFAVRIENDSSNPKDPCSEPFETTVKNEGVYNDDSCYNDTTLRSVPYRFKPGDVYHAWVHPVVNGQIQSCVAETRATIPYNCREVGGPPQPGTGTENNPGKQRIFWSSIENAQRYDIRIDDLADGWDGSCSSPNGDTCVNGVGTNYYDNYDFKAGHSYKYWVHAVNDCSYSIPGASQIMHIAGGDASTCQGTLYNNQPVTSQVGETVCGLDRHDYTCTANGFVREESSNTCPGVGGPPPPPPPQQPPAASCPADLHIDTPNTSTNKITWGGGVEATDYALRVQNKTHNGHDGNPCDDVNRDTNGNFGDNYNDDTCIESTELHAAAVKNPDSATKRSIFYKFNPGDDYIAWVHARSTTGIIDNCVKVVEFKAAGGPNLIGSLDEASCTNGVRGWIGKAPTGDPTNGDQQFNVDILLNGTPIGAALANQKGANGADAEAICKAMGAGSCEACNTGYPLGDTKCNHRFAFTNVTGKTGKITIAQLPGQSKDINCPGTPPPPVCPLKEKGDADCKDGIKGRDFEIWRSEFVAGCKASNLAACGSDEDGDGSAMDADFDKSQEVKGRDFELWRTNFK